MHGHCCRQAPSSAEPEHPHLGSCPRRCALELQAHHCKLQLAACACSLYRVKPIQTASDCLVLSSPSALPDARALG